MSNIAVFGAGYAGLVSGVGLAELGHAVVIRDIAPERVADLEAGRVPFFEPGLEELLHHNADRLRFTTSIDEALADAEFLFVCVGTPPTYSGEADLSAVWTVIEELPAGQRGVLVMKSTVPVGTGEKVRAALDARGLTGLGYASCPEFLAEGTAVRDFMEPDRVVIGAFDEADGDAVADLHRALDTPVVRMDVASAEMVKLAANAFLATRISFINEIANVCELVGADVEQVAIGMGHDRRIGSRYLRAGLGYGGSCLVGEETVLVRSRETTRLVRLDTLFAEFAVDDSTALVRPDDLEVLAWREGADTAEFFPVAAATRRPFASPLVALTTKMGRRLHCTPDHPLITADAAGATRVKVAAELTTADWLPVAQFAAAVEPARFELDVLEGLGAAGLERSDVIVRPSRAQLAELTARSLQPALAEHPRGHVARSHDIVRAGALRLHELDELALPIEGAMLGTARNGTYVPATIPVDESFWRVVGLYIAEGHCTADGLRRRLYWSFHPSDEAELVEEVARFWRRLGVRADVRNTPTSVHVSVSSRLVAGLWNGVLGLGSNCYEQRIPDLAWAAPEPHRRALLSGLWHGDGSWSRVAGGPSVVLEYGTVSRELADGMLRLLGDLGITARLKIGRTAKSTCDTYWLSVSGASQVESLLDFVPEQSRPELASAIAEQAKRIAPTGYRRHHPNAAWVRVKEVAPVESPGFVYSLEVPGAHTFVTTGGLVVHNCFPKDVSFLKLLAGNSGYHFQLVNAVMDVNELQMRRPVGKLNKHLGSLRGKRIALLGLAFKPHTDDLREAPSLVLASRLLAEGAEVVAWDPVADATGVLRGVEHAASALEALRGADGAVVVTEWPELGELPWARVKELMRSPVIVDGRNHLDPVLLRSLGFTYEGMGRASSPFSGLPETHEPAYR